MAIQLSGSLAITGSLVATSQIIAQTLNVQQVTSSIVYSSGSNIFGNSVSNTQQFTGSLQVSSSTSYILGNVGIGTTSPFGTTANRTVLSVNGTTDVSLNVGSGGTQRAYLYGSSTYADLGTIGSLPLTFSPNNTERVRITSGGNVGIGTTSPSSILEVSKMGAQTASIFINQTDANEATIRFKSTHGSDSDYRVGASILVNSAFEIYSVVAASTRFIVTNSGSIGIGTTTPNERLQVAGAISATGTATTSFASSATMDYFSTGARFISRGANTSTAGTFTFLIESSNSSIATNAMFIANSANVGIGTTAPLSRLHINTGTNQNLRIRPGTDVSAANGVAINSRDDADATLQQLSLRASDVLMLVTGNVGIGTTTPNSTLQVSKGGVTFQVTDTNKTANNTLSIYGLTQTSFAIATGNSGSFSGGEKIVINDNGNIGIGTTNPTRRLYVTATSGEIARFDGSGYAADSAAEIDVLGPQSNGQLNVGIGGSTFVDSTNNIQNKGFITTGTGLTGLNLRSDAGFVQITAGGVAASNEVARFTAAGNVGIGTTSPSARLHVEGNTILNGNVSANTTYNAFALNVAGIAYIIGGSVWVNDAYGYANASSVNTGMYPDSSHNITFKNNNSTSVYINSSRNVGIGTTNPYGRLHLTGNYDGAQNTLNLENNWPNTHRTSLINFWAYYNSTNPLAIIEAGQDVSATNAGVIEFKTMLAGAAPATRMTIKPDGTVQPGANGTQDLGTSSLRWATVFISDLDMSNGIGDYTIVEGEEDLFLYNNKTNKVFKFLIQEVDPSTAPPKKIRN